MSSDSSVSDLAESRSVAIEPGPQTFAPRQAASDADFVLAGLTRFGAFCIIVMLVALLAVLTMAAWPSITTYKARFLYSSQWRPNSLDVPVHDAQGHVVFDSDGEMVTKTLPPEFGAWPVDLRHGGQFDFGFDLRRAAELRRRAVSGAIVSQNDRWRHGFISRRVPGRHSVDRLRYVGAVRARLRFFSITWNPALKHALGWIPGISAWLFTETETVAGHAARQEIPLTGNDMFCGGLVLAIMILPIITAISRDVLKGVPRAQLEGTLALGATWWQSSREMLRYSRSGLFGAVMLGLARAAGETMAITMVIGNNTQVRASLFAPAQTMSSLLANEFAEANSDIHRSALAEVALILLVMSLLFNIVARWLVVGSQRGMTAH